MYTRKTVRINYTFKIANALLAYLVKSVLICDGTGSQNFTANAKLGCTPENKDIKLNTISDGIKPVFYHDKRIDSQEFPN